MTYNFDTLFQTYMDWIDNAITNGDFWYKTRKDYGTHESLWNTCVNYEESVLLGEIDTSSTHCGLTHDQLMFCIDHLDSD